MERSQILATMGGLKLYGMKAAFDEVITVAVKRPHEPQQVVGDLLEAEIAEKQARSIKYQITIAKLPLAKDVAAARFSSSSSQLRTVGSPRSFSSSRTCAGGAASGPAPELHRAHVSAGCCHANRGRR